MTDQEISIAVAEACGWIRWQNDDGQWLVRDGTGNVVYHDWLDAWPIQKLPNYCGDLNAMHEAEITLTPGFTPWKPMTLTRQWVGRVWSTANRDDSWDKYTSYLDAIAGPGMAVIATARQRAEAFLRTIGKWKETP